MTRREELDQAAAEFDAYVRRLVDERRSSPGDDLVSAMIAAEEEGDRLSDDECVSLVLDVLNGGIDTTQSELAHGVRLFAGHPDQWAALGDDTVARAAGRRGGSALRAGCAVHDPGDARRRRVPGHHVPRRHGRVRLGVEREPRGGGRPDAERFDITAERGAAKSLTFGAGPHFCMGANLARAELQEGLAFLAPRMRALELDGEPGYGTITGPVRDAAPSPCAGPPDGEQARSFGYTPGAPKACRLVHRGRAS